METLRWLQCTAADKSANLERWQASCLTHGVRDPGTVVHGDSSLQHSIQTREQLAQAGIRCEDGYNIPY